MDVTNRALMNVSRLDFLGFFERIGRWFAGIARRSARAASEWNRNRRARRALLNMSDHLLRDIGISRGSALREGR